MTKSTLGSSSGSKHAKGAYAPVNGLVDVIAIERNRVEGFLRWMTVKSCLRYVKDKPALAGVGVREAQFVSDKCSLFFWFRCVEESVHALDHVEFLLL